MITETTLQSKVAIVTGGGQGLGRATAEALSRAGACVAISYLDDPDGINRQRGEAVASALGSGAVALPGDVCSEESIAGFFTEVVERFDHVDIVINNAGIIRDRTMSKMSSEQWQQVLDTNLSGVWRVCREAIGPMRDGGRIVNLASISGVAGFFGQTNYSAAKAGVIGLTKALSKEVAKRNITVNAVAPGVVLTEMGQTIPEQMQSEMLRQIPLGRFGKAEEIADAILFLCSPMADYISGQTIHVNGGWWG